MLIVFDIILASQKRETDRPKIGSCVPPDALRRHEMSEVSLCLEDRVRDGLPDRWKVVNHSGGIEQRIVAGSYGIEGVVYRGYSLFVTGKELEGKVIIVQKKIDGRVTWKIFRMAKGAMGRPAFAPIEPRGTDTPSIGGWFWEGGCLVWRHMNDTRDRIDSNSGNFCLDLNSWGVATALERNWLPFGYWAEMHREAQIVTPTMPEKIDGLASDHFNICYRLIADKQKLEAHEDAKTRVEQILRSIMDDDRRVEHGRILALMNADGPTANIASVINDKLHDICDALGIELGPGFTYRHERKPAGSHRQPLAQGRRDNGQLGPF